MKSSLAVLLALVAAACGSSPVAPAPVVAPADPTVTVMTYAINLPSPSLVEEYGRTRPEGLRLDPYTAQQTYDYTVRYGSPNVYAGASAPHCPIVGEAVVVAPLHVATMPIFEAQDWPSVGLLPGVRYVWVGRFVYTAAPFYAPPRCQEPITR